MIDEEKLETPPQFLFFFLMRVLAKKVEFQMLAVLRGSTQSAYSARDVKNINI